MKSRKIEAFYAKGKIYWNENSIPAGCPYVKAHLETISLIKKLKGLEKDAQNVWFVNRDNRISKEISLFNNVYLAYLECPEKIEPKGG
jgi:hypothetical protein